jgi:uncharacterized protein YkwD
MVFEQSSREELDMTRTTGRHRGPATVGMSRGLAALLATLALSGGVGVAIATEHVLGLSKDASATAGGDALAADSQKSSTSDGSGEDEGRPGGHADATTAIPVDESSTTSTAPPSATTTRKPPTATITTRPTSTRSTTPRASATTKSVSSDSGGSTSGGGTMDAASLEVLRLVNVERAKVGCGAVKGNSLLTKAAYLHSKDMAVNNYFSHDSQDGRTMVDRIKAQGYTKGTLGENIAAGQRTAESVMNSWMDSPGHKANILNCSYTELGVGHYVGGSYGQYWTQDFGG